MTIQIEKGIPIPPAASAPNHADVVKKMECGDSIFVETSRAAKSLAQALRNAGFRQTTRKIEGGYRVWKLESIR